MQSPGRLEQRGEENCHGLWRGASRRAARGVLGKGPPGRVVTACVQERGEFWVLPVVPAGWCSSRQSGGGVGAAPTPAALCSNVGSREMLLRLASIRGVLCQPPSPANVKK